jgi:hypothetical protein
MTKAEMAALFDADWWPLEMAVAWLATGKRRTAAIVNQMTSERRRGADRRSTVVRYLLMLQIMCEHETVPGSLFRREARGDWKPDNGAATAVEWATKTAIRAMWHRVSWGDLDGERKPIPPNFWRGAEIRDDRKHGLFLTRRDTNVTWSNVDVPASVFRRWPGKRGQPPIGLQMGPLQGTRGRLHFHAKFLIGCAKAVGNTSRYLTLGGIAKSSNLGYETVAHISRTMVRPGRNRRKGRPRGHSTR